METQPVSPLKIEHQKALFSPLATELWFGRSAVHLERLPGLFWSEPKTFTFLCKISKYVLTKILTLQNALLPVILFIILDFTNVYLLRREKKVNHQTGSDLGERQTFTS